MRPATTSFDSRKPLHERVADLIRARDASRAAAAAQARAQDMEEAPFVPRLSENTARLAAAMHAQGPREDVADRLAGGASLRLAKAQHAHLAYEAPQECTFAPGLSANSERIVAEMDALGRPADFVRRQAAYAYSSQRQRSAAEACAPAMAECTFWPERSSAIAEVLANGRLAHQLAESAGERVHRLAVADVVRKAAMRSSLRAAHEVATQPFAPSLSLHTRRLAPEGTPLRELVADTRREAARAAAAAAVEEQLAGECTFAPDLAASAHSARLTLGPQPPRARASAFVTDPDAAAAAMREAAAERQAAAARAQELRQQEELAACTFAPKLLPRLPTADAPVLVRGLGAFIDKQAAAARQRREQAERERKAFLLDAASKPPRTSHTVPRPFALAFELRAAEREAKRAQIEAQVAAQRSAELTFAPRTNEGEVTRTVRRLLAASAQ